MSCMLPTRRAPPTSGSPTTGHVKPKRSWSSTRTNPQVAGDVLGGNVRVSSPVDYDTSQRSQSGADASRKREDTRRFGDPGTERFDLEHVLETECRPQGEDEARGSEERAI